MNNHRLTIFMDDFTLDSLPRSYSLSLDVHFEAMSLHDKSHIFSLVDLYD